MAGLVAPTLDRSRHFGNVIPPERNAHYHQDGFYFDRTGSLVEALLSPEDRDRLKHKAALSAARKIAKDAIVKQLVESGYEPAEAEKIATEDDPADAPTDIQTESDSVDLVRWAKGTRRYLWAEVVKAAKEKYGFAAHSKASLADFLVEEGVISRDEVRAV